MRYISFRIKLDSNRDRINKIRFDCGSFRSVSNPIFSKKKNKFASILEFLVILTSSVYKTNSDRIMPWCHYDNALEPYSWVNDHPIPIYLIKDAETNMESNYPDSTLFIANITILQQIAGTLMCKSQIKVHTCLQKPAETIFFINLHIELLLT